MTFGNWRWLNTLSRNTRGRAAGRKGARPARPALEVLEGREVPAVVFVDNLSDYVITNDQGALGHSVSTAATPSPGTRAPAAPTAGRSAA